MIVLLLSPAVDAYSLLRPPSLTRAGGLGVRWAPTKVGHDFIDLLPDFWPDRESWL